MSQARLFDRCRSALQTACAQCQSASRKLAFDFAIYSSEGIAQFGSRQVSRKVAAIQTRRRAFVDGARESGGKPWRVGGTFELAAVESRHRPLYQQIKHGARNFRPVRRPGIDKAGKGLNETGAKHKSLASDLISEMMGHRCRGNQQANARVIFTERFAKGFENRVGFSGTSRSGEQQHLDPAYSNRSTEWVLRRGILLGTSMRNFAPLISQSSVRRAAPRTVERTI